MNEVEEYQLIYSMCLTYQHDYGLWADEERKALYRNMESVYRHNIKPLLVKNIDKKEIIPKDVDRALFIGKFHCEENVEECERICDEADTPSNQYKEQAYNMRKVLDQFKHDLKYLEKVCKKYGVDQ